MLCDQNDKRQHNKSVAFHDNYNCQDYLALMVYEWNIRVQSAGGITMTGETWSIQRKICPSATSSTMNPSQTATWIY